jgi:hypothetical protein
MVRRKRKSLERDAELLKASVPIMKAALAQLSEDAAEIKLLQSERDYARLSLKVILGENEKLLSQLGILHNQVFEQSEKLALLLSELEDVEAIANEYEAYDPTEEPFA